MTWWLICFTPFVCSNHFGVTSQQGEKGRVKHIYFKQKLLKLLYELINLKRLCKIAIPRLHYILGIQCLSIMLFTNMGQGLSTKTRAPSCLLIIKWNAFFSRINHQARPQNQHQTCPLIPSPSSDMPPYTIPIIRHVP